MQIEQQYPLFLSQVNTLTERRQKVTTTYLSVNAAIIGMITFVLKDVQIIGWGKNLSVLILLLAGIVTCDLWRRLIRQYSTSIGWWYTQLRNLEKDMSDSNKLLTKEYQELYSTKSKTTPIGMTRYEAILTYIFTTIYSILILVSVVIFILS